MGHRTQAEMREPPPERFHHEIFRAALRAAGEMKLEGWLVLKNTDRGGEGGDLVLGEVDELVLAHAKAAIAARGHNDQPRLAPVVDLHKDPAAAAGNDHAPANQWRDGWERPMGQRWRRRRRRGRRGPWAVAVVGSHEHCLAHPRLLPGTGLG